MHTRCQHSNYRRVHRTALLVLLTTACCAHAGEIYRWVDENGVVNFTQQKPKDVSAQQLTTVAGGPTIVRNNAQRPAPVAGDVPAADKPLNTSQQQMLDDLHAAEQARREEVARIRAANCQKSRKVLAQLSAKDRIRVRADDGSERVMSEEERQQRIEEAQQGIVQNCATS